MKKKEMKFTEKLLAYKQRQKPSRSLIHSDVDLPTGSNVREVLEKLMESRRVGSVPAEEPIKLRPKRYFAICIVIVDQLYHEEIWKRWIEEGSTPTSSYGAEIFVHAKYPERIQSPWIQSRLIEKSFSPEWNSTEVVRAMLQLLSFTLHSQTLHPQTDFERLIFATESCIPVLPLHECGNLLFASDHSWVDAYNTPKNTWEDRNCFKPVNRDIIPPKAVTKAIPGWIMLVKKHAEEIVALLNRFGGWDFRESERPSGSQIVDIVSAFGPSGQWTEFCGGVFAPEEVFFPTMLSLLGYIQPENPSKEEIIRKPVIYAEWKRNGDANPISFSSLTKDLLDKISQKKIPFARKFPKDSISVEVWSSLVLTDLSKVEDEDVESSSEPQLKKLKS